MHSPTLTMAQAARLSPYVATFTEVAEQYDLSPAEFSKAADEVGATGCPWFSVHVYGRTHIACARIVSERNATPSEFLLDNAPRAC